MATKAEIMAQLDEAGVSYNQKAVKAELEFLLDAHIGRTELDAIANNEEEVVPEETPAPAPAPKPEEPKLVRLVADAGVTMNGTSFYTDGVRVNWTGNTALVSEEVAAFVVARERGVKVSA